MGFGKENTLTVHRQPTNFVITIKPSPGSFCFDLGKFELNGIDPNTNVFCGSERKITFKKASNKSIEPYLKKEM